MITLIQIGNSSPSLNVESEDEGFSENSSISSGITIKGPSGSVRGIKHCVRQNIKNYYDIITSANSYKSRNYRKEELNKCVLYSTTLGIIRSTFENCRKMKAILYQNLIVFEEKDIYINSEFRDELLERGDRFIVPSLFVHGKYFGGIELVDKLNESGQLIELLIDFRLTNQSNQSDYFNVCECCGNAKFIPCNHCNGSKKSYIHHYSCDSITLRCSHCNATGLIKCPKCQNS